MASPQLQRQSRAPARRPQPRRTTGTVAPSRKRGTSTKAAPGRVQRIGQETVLKKYGVDTSFLLIVLVLLSFGFVMMFSASMPKSIYSSSENPYGTVLKQLVWAVLGIIAMIVTMNFDYRRLKKLAGPLFIASLGLMLLVPFIGVEVNGAKRWLGIGGLTFQPSEVLKITLILFLSKTLADMGDKKLKNFKTGVIPCLLIAGISAGCAVLQSHLSAALLFVGISMCLLVAAGMQWKHLFLMGGAGLCAAIPLAVLESYRLNRLLAYRDPWSDLQGIGWQIVQSLYAIGSGGIFGLGIGESRQKHMWLPEASNDYIFAVICEEIGFIGAAVVIVLFILLLWRGISIAMKAPDRFSSLLTFGIMAMIGLQVIINIGVVTNVLPSTGMQLPFFSSGGSSLIFVMGAMGMVLNVSKYTNINKRKDSAGPAPAAKRK